MNIIANFSLVLAFSLSATLSEFWQALPFNQNTPPIPKLQGYVEGEYTYLTAATAGTLQSLKIQRGSMVKTGDLLFQLDPEPEASALREAEQRVFAAQARLKDLRKGLRPSEINALEAQQKQIQADLEFSLKELARYERLLAKKAIPRENVDTQQTTVQRNQARLAEIQAQLTTAKIGGRNDAIIALEADSAAAQATLEKTRWSLQQKQVITPVSGTVTEVFRYPGEWVAVGNPVLAVLAPERVKLRFFVPESKLGALQLGQVLRFQCDACPENWSAPISYIAPKAEYTPPIVYSQDNRSKWVFLVEAIPKPEIAARLHVGQAVDVEFLLATKIPSGE
jgi:HlyD family secretion protein